MRKRSDAETPSRYIESLPTPSERLYAAAFADHLAGRSAEPDLPDAVRESRAVVIRAVLEDLRRGRSSTVH